MKILILGHNRHGKDTVAEFIQKNYNLSFNSSSQAAADIFIYDTLKEKYGYTSSEQCFQDRVNHRAEWYTLICEYNKYDKIRLAKEILEDNDIYVGLRSNEELIECKNEGLFDYIVGVYDPRKPHESFDSFNIDIFSECHFIIPNGSTLEDLEERVITIFDRLLRGVNFGALHELYNLGKMESYLTN